MSPTPRSKVDSWDSLGEARVLIRIGILGDPP